VVSFDFESECLSLMMKEQISFNDVVFHSAVGRRLSSWPLFQLACFFETVIITTFIVSHDVIEREHRNLIRIVGNAGAYTTSYSSEFIICTVASFEPEASKPCE